MKLFHVTSTRNRKSILEHGLDWKRMREQRGIAGGDRAEAECVFLARDEGEAEWFVAISRHNHESVDIWEVIFPEELDVDAEPPGEMSFVEIGGYLGTTEPIPAERVRLLRSDP